QAHLAALMANLPEEPQPELPTLPENPTEEQRESYEAQMLLHRNQDGGGSVMTGPVKAALRQSKRWAKERRSDQFTAAVFLAELLGEESNARRLLIQRTHPERLERAIATLRESSDPSSTGFSADSLMADSRKLMDKVWPKAQAEVREEVGDEVQMLMEDLYAKDSSRYEEPLDVASELAAARALDSEHRYLAMGGTLLHAAGNEARIRRAPEATLDHLFLALLRDGSDTAAYLDRKGVDRESWRDRVDDALPRFAEGPRWPINSRDLTFSLHENSVTERRSLPEGKTWLDIPAEELKDYFETTIDETLRFTDLRNLKGVHAEPETMAYLLFVEAGITKEELAAEIEALSRE
ncbi:hypothetical protein EON79_05635, partial [bacterium]